MKFSHLASLTFAIALAFSATGCKTRAVKTTPLGENGSGTTGTNPNPGAGTVPGAGNEVSSSTTGLASNPAGAHDGWTPNATVFEADTVHFAYDSSAVRPDDTSKINAVAEYLKSNSADAVRIEGHCDERGTEEYNRALGDRRALAVREKLASMGIEPSRIDTESFGKDRPEDPGHNDAAWSKNRRAVFILLTPPNK